MPELPEVETLRRELNRALRGQQFKRADILWLKTVAPHSTEKFNKLLRNKTITAVARRAKVLIFQLRPGDLNLLVHLKMTGQLVYKNIVGGHPVDPTKHTRAIFYLADRSQLLFNDLRKFGWLKLVTNTELAQTTDQVGVEPLSREFTLEKFVSLLQRYPRRPLKAFLLDQTLIAGLGNIYVDESCFLARILPMRPVGSLTSAESKKLHQAIIEILKLAISKKGTSARNYIRSTGERGGFVPYLNVYGRGAEKCKRCGHPISKIKFAGRGTHFCSHCQK